LSIGIEEKAGIEVYHHCSARDTVENRIEKKAGYRRFYSP
jgi:hypothetical protein